MQQNTNLSRNPSHPWAHRPAAERTVASAARIRPARCSHLSLARRGTRRRTPPARLVLVLLRRQTREQERPRAGRAWPPVSVGRCPYTHARYRSGKRPSLRIALPPHIKWRVQRVLVLSMVQSGAARPHPHASLQRLAACAAPCDAGRPLRRSLSAAASSAPRRARSLGGGCNAAAA